MKILKDANEALSQSIGTIEENFDYTSLNSCYLDNKSKYRSLLTQYNQTCKVNTENSYFKPSSFQFPSFDRLEEDISILPSFGRIRDNGHHTLPIVIFNTYKFQMLEYDDSLKQFNRWKVTDEDNTLDKVPKYFKYQVISNDEVILVGGSEELTSKKDPKKVVYVASNKAFKITKGHIKRLDNALKKPRQYFNLVHDEIRNQIFIIGGFNEKEGALSSCEKLCLEAHTFSKIPSLKQRRYNWAAALVENSHIYVFNGVGKNQDLDTIEKYSISLDFWEKINLKTPFKVHNHFIKSIGSNDILILGGKQDLEGQKNVSQSMTSVFIFNTEWNWLIQLRKLDFNLKIGDAFVNNKRQALLYVPENKSVVTYDLDKNYPQRDRFLMSKKASQESKNQQDVSKENCFSDKESDISLKEWVELKDFNAFSLEKGKGKPQENDNLVDTIDIP